MTVTTCPVAQAELLALTDLYSSTMGSSWNNAFGWDSAAGGGDPCVDQWYGITCSSLSPNHIVYVVLEEVIVVSN